MPDPALMYLALGLVQGLTEWLPVSSSGHLVLVQSLWGMEARTLADALLHLGTVLAALVYFRKDIGRLVGDFFRAGPSANALHTWILLASLPIIAAGFLFRDIIDRAFSSLWLVGAFLIATGVILLANRYLRPTGKLTLRTAVWIGIIQCVSLLPGISRSGTTITAGRALGVGSEAAARFSFFISIIPIIGATVLKVGEDHAAFQPVMLLGMAASFAVGYATIDVLMRAVRNSKLEYFGLYALAAGALVLLVPT